MIRPIYTTNINNSVIVMIGYIDTHQTSLCHYSLGMKKSESTFLYHIVIQRISSILWE